MPVLKTKHLADDMAEGAAWLSICAALKVVAGRKQLFNGLEPLFVAVVLNDIPPDGSVAHDTFCDIWRECKK